MKGKYAVGHNNFYVMLLQKAETLQPIVIILNKHCCARLHIFLLCILHHTHSGMEHIEKHIYAHTIFSKIMPFMK
jgi:hypothetical protein